MSSIIDNMKQFGLSEYEIKAYLGLLEQYPVNGYTLSKETGIPRSRIYDVIRSLKEKQLIFELQEGDTKKYKPLSPQMLVNKYKREMDDALHAIESYTVNIYDNEKEDNSLIVITGWEEILRFLDQFIREAKTRVAISVWQNEWSMLKGAVDDARSRGVKVAGIFFGDKTPYDELVLHRRLGRYQSEKKARYISVAIDGQQVVSGVICDGLKSQVTWIKDAGFVEMTEDYISHDVMINKYAHKLSGHLKEEFEVFSDEVRRDYFGFDSEEYKQIVGGEFKLGAKNGTKK